MEQKNYNLEIVCLLLHGRAHARKIAASLGTSHMTVLRKLNALSNENVVDFVMEGKNKPYFLKKTTEAKAYVFMAENYRLVRAIELYPRLRAIISKIQKNCRVRMALLFGSYAKGIATRSSDIDIYVETEDRALRRELQLIDSKLSIKIGKYEKESPLIKEIEKNHVILKGIEKYYEKNKFFD